MDDLPLEQRRRWRINREVSAGDLIAIVVAIVAVLSSYFSLDKRVAVIETITAQNQMSLEKNIGDIKNDLRRLADKIDGYIERRVER